MNNSIIRVLPQNLINQIAAGEVVERPSAALKELIENAIDAGSNRIDVKIKEGGKTFFSVTDNGKGMTKEELELCVERHATSKLPDDDLFNISYLGFRGEALPSIASVSKLKITSKSKSTQEAWCIQVHGGKKEDVEPVAAPFGTTVEVQDLFYATPARLKFLKSTLSETSSIKDVINRLAMAYPNIHFSLSDEKRLVLNYAPVDSLLLRVAQIIGKSFDENALAIDVDYDGTRLTGFVGLPTYTRSTSQDQYLFVNGRFVKDKVLIGAIRGAFQGLISHEVHPVLALFLSVPPHEVDVNVHPAKTEVRFSNAAKIRGLLVSSIRNVLAENGHKTNSTIGIGALEKSFSRIPMSPVSHTSSNFSFNDISNFTIKEELPNFISNDDSTLKPVHYPEYTAPQQTIPFKDALYSVKTETVEEQPVQDDFPPLGFAKAQLHKTYIVSQTKDSIVITDQHAAHERLIFNRLKEQMSERAVAQQPMLVPYELNVNVNEKEFIIEHLSDIREMGFEIEESGLYGFAIKAIPLDLQHIDIKAFFEDILSDISGYRAIRLTEILKDKLASAACKAAVKGGMDLSREEIDALFALMDGDMGLKCPHGRPVVVKMSRTELEKMFKRIV